MYFLQHLISSNNFSNIRVRTNKLQNIAQNRFSSAIIYRCARKVPSIITPFQLPARNSGPPMVRSIMCPFPFPLKLYFCRIPADINGFRQCSPLKRTRAR